MQAARRPCACRPATPRGPWDWEICGSPGVGRMQTYTRWGRGCSLMSHLCPEWSSQVTTCQKPPQAPPFLRLAGTLRAGRWGGHPNSNLGGRAGVGNQQSRGGSGPPGSRRGTGSRNRKEEAATAQVGQEGEEDEGEGGTNTEDGDKEDDAESDREDRDEDADDEDIDQDDGDDDDG